MRALLDLALWLARERRRMTFAEFRKWQSRRYSFAAGPIGPNRGTDEMRARRGRVRRAEVGPRRLA